MSEQFRYLNLVPKQLDFVGVDGKPALTSKVGNQSIIRNVIKPLGGSDAVDANGVISYRITTNSGAFMNSAPRLQAKIQFYVVAAGPDEAIVAINNKVGLHSLPLNRLISKCDVQFQNTSMTTNVASQVDYFLNSMDVDTLQAISPASKPDVATSYFDFLNDPLRSGVDTINAGESRGIGSTFNLSASAVDGNGRVLVTIILDEAIMAKPFQFQDPLEARAMPNFSADLELTLVSDFAKAVLASNGVQCFSDSPAAPGAPTEGVIVSEMRLVVEQFVPQPAALPKLPEKFYYNSHYIQRLPITTRQNITNGNTATFTINASEIQGMPSMFCLALWADRLDYKRPTCALQLVPGSVKINMSGKNDVLGTFDDARYPQALYQLSAKNGYNQRAVNFLGGFLGGVGPNTVYKGGACVLYFSPQDINLTNFVQENVNVKIEIDAEFQVRNQGLSAGAANDPAVSDATAAQLRGGLFLLHENVVEYDMKTNEWSDRRAWISPEDVAKADARFIDDSEQASHAIRGGRKSGFLNFVNKAAESWRKFAKSDTGRTLRNAAKQGVKAALGQDSAVSKLVSGSGGAVVNGGRALSNKELMAMIA